MQTLAWIVVAGLGMSLLALVGTITIVMPPARLGYLILLADGLHNLIGGLAVGGAFVVDTRVGAVTWLVVAAHEVPQELGDFGVLVHSGWRRRSALAWTSPPRSPSCSAHSSHTGWQNGSTSHTCCRSLRGTSSTSQRPTSCPRSPRRAAHATSSRRRRRSSSGSDPARRHPSRLTPPPTTGVDQWWQLDATEGRERHREGGRLEVEGVGEQLVADGTTGPPR